MENRRKYIFLGMIAVIPLLLNCNNQKKERPAGKTGNVTFEEKQKFALGSDKNEDFKGTTDGYNLRRPAAMATPGVVHIRSLFTVNIDPEIPDFFKDFLMTISLNEIFAATVIPRRSG